MRILRISAALFLDELLKIILSLAVTNRHARGRSQLCHACSKPLYPNPDDKTVVDFKLLQQLVECGYLRTACHPDTDMDLHIFDYTSKAPVGGPYSVVTLETRGMVTDSRGKVVARWDTALTR